MSKDKKLDVTHPIELPNKPKTIEPHELTHVADAVRERLQNVMTPHEQFTSRLIAWLNHFLKETRNGQPVNNTSFMRFFGYVTDDFEEVMMCDSETIRTVEALMLEIDSLVKDHPLYEALNTGEKMNDFLKKLRG